MSNQRGAALIEMGVLISMIALVIFLSVRHFSWKINCNTAVAGWALTMRPIGYSSYYGSELVLGMFGRRYVACIGGMNGAVAIMTESLCNGDVDSDWVRGWRAGSGL